MLGGFEVRDELGQLVPQAAWRTTKTRELVRLLAGSAGQVVSADLLVEALWPDVEPERGRASLRTAASQVRQVLGAGHLDRRNGGLVLTGVWVDALAFEALTASAGHQLAAGELAAGVGTAWEAVTLYAGDLHQDEPGAAEVAAEREHYRRLLKRLLLDAADAACRLGWLRDAAELGHRALRLDPCAEAAYRVLMRTYAHLGETEQALGLYETCRSALADAYGADPGPETRALHQELLQPVAPVTTDPPFVGRAPCLDTVRAALPDVVEEHRPAGFLVTGPQGSGRTRFVREVASGWPHRVVEVRGADAAAEPDALAGALAATSREAPLLVVVDDLRRTDERSLTALRAALSGAAEPLLVLATVSADEAQPDHPLLVDGSCALLALPPLSADEVGQLLHPVLGVAPAASLVEELTGETGGLPSAVLAAVHRLRGSGQLLSTAKGMARVPWNPSRAPVEEGARLTRARQHTAPHGGPAVDLLAVLDRPTPSTELARLTGVPLDELAPTLGQLCDLGVVTGGVEGHRLRNAVVRELAYRWLRPSVRRALHRQVAGTARLPTADRIDHWLAGGDPALACAAALQAADEALLRGDDEQGRTQLVRVLSFAADHADGSADVVGLHERLAAVQERLGRTSEARTSIAAALELARGGPPAVLADLHRRMARLATSERESLRCYERGAEVPGLDVGERRRIALEAAAVLTDRRPEQALALLRRAVDEADGTSDLTVQVEARVLLAATAARQRQFTEAYAVGKAAVSLAELAGEPVLFVRAAHVLAQAPAWLGGALRERGLLARLLEQARTSGDPAAICDVSLTSCLVLHELGDAEAERVWSPLQGLAQSTGRLRVHRLLDAVLSLDRDQVRRTERVLAELLGEPGDRLVDSAGHVVLARLRAGLGDVDGAVAALDTVVEDAAVTGVTLLVPEAAAHRALLQAPTDVAAAERSLTLATEVAGERSYPREQVCMLRARAALLGAVGRPEAGATMALAAALAARRAGLVFQEAQSQRLRDALRTPVTAGTTVAPGPRTRTPGRRRETA